MRGVTREGVALEREWHVGEEGMTEWHMREWNMRGSGTQEGVAKY